MEQDRARCAGAGSDSPAGAYRYTSNARKRIVNRLSHLRLSLLIAGTHEMFGLDESFRNLCMRICEEPRSKSRPNEFPAWTLKALRPKALLFRAI
jgi:hypothetical protein